MVRAVQLHRLLRLSLPNQRLLVEAVAALAAAAAVVRFLPFRHAIRSAARRGSTARQIGSAELRRICWSVERAGEVVPWRAVCLQQSLAAQWMLRRRGVDALLHYGVGKKADGELAAHAWLTADGEGLIGADAARGFRTVATYPEEAMGR
ncbi:MAG: lasso peptide biosynthesis B2 protein [Sphingomicrobium sp.]|nr:lasso peptide biosynthesis B2 protein [Sphingomonadales bacterium]